MNTDTYTTTERYFTIGLGLKGGTDNPFNQVYMKMEVQQAEGGYAFIHADVGTKEDVSDAHFIRFYYTNDGCNNVTLPYIHTCSESERDEQMERLWLEVALGEYLLSSVLAEYKEDAYVLPDPRLLDDKVTFTEVVSDDDLIVEIDTRLTDLEVEESK